MLEFESQTPGAPGGSIFDGDFTLTAQSVEPGGILCATPGTFGCPTFSNGQFLMTQAAGSVTLARTDGAAFDLESFSYYTPFASGLVSADGTTSGGATVSVAFLPASGSFVLGTLGADFDDVVSVTITYPLGVFDLGIDDITIGDPPPEPFEGTPGTLTLVGDDRSIEARGIQCIYLDPGEQCDPQETNSAMPSPDFAPFDASVVGGPGSASQDSTTTTADLQANGVAEGYADIDGLTSSSGTGDSIYDVRFDLAASARIRIQGTLTNEDTSTIDIGSGPVSFALTRSGLVLYQASVPTPDDGPADLGFDDIVPPGSYRVVAHANGNEHARSIFDFHLVANPAGVVPLLTGPAVALLGFGLAAVGLRGLGRRRRKTPRP